MNLTKRILSLFVVVIILMVGFVIKPAPAKAIKNFTVEVTPKVVGEVAEYKFQFTVEKKTGVHQWVYMSFPKGTILTPPLPEGEIERKERLSDIMYSIKIQPSGVPCCDEWCPGLPIFVFKDDGTMDMKFSNCYEFDPEKGQFSCITIKKEAGITNPTQAGTYTYKISTQQEPTMFESQPVEITEKLPTPELELVAQLPIYDQIMWYGVYPSVRKVKLPNDHPGFAYVKTLDGGFFDTYYVLGLYDSIDKRITREIYLCSGKELESNDGIECEPAILVDENNMIYVSIKKEIHVFSNNLSLHDILIPDLDTLHISSLLRLNFFKNNSIVALRDGIVLFIDKTSGVLADHIAIDKSIDSDTKGLKTVTIQDYTKDSILIYFSVDEENAQNTQKVVVEVDITTKTIKQKWIIKKENYPKIPYANNFFSLSYTDPWFIFWTPCPPQNSIGVQLFIINTKTNQETLIELPLCYVNDEWIEKEGDTLFAYIRCPDGSNDNRQEGIYRFPLNGYLP